MPRRGRNLADEFFEKSEKDAIGFEITLAALLATACLTFQIDGRELLGPIIAFALLLITLLRRMAKSSPFAPENRIYSTTSPLIEVSTTLSLVYLTSYLTKAVSGYFGSLDLPLTFALLSILLVSSLVLVDELVLYSYFVWWNAKFKEKAERGDPLEGVWRDVSILAYLISRARRDRSAYQRIPKSAKQDIDFSDVEAGNVLRSAIGGGLFLFLMYSPPLLLLGVTVGVTGLLLVPAVVYLHDHSCYWYVAHGNTSYEDFRKPWWAIILWTMGYSLVALYLMNSLPFG